jgi:hypothetical protein
MTTTNLDHVLLLTDGQRARIEALKSAREVLTRVSLLGGQAPNPDDLMIIADYILDSHTDVEHIVNDGEAGLHLPMSTIDPFMFKKSRQW